MIKFFYDSLETLQKVKFATKKDYVSLWIGVVFAIIVCGAFFIGVDTMLTWAYKTFYSIMKSPSWDGQSSDSLGSWDIVLSTTWSNNLSGESIVSSWIATTPMTWWLPIMVGTWS